MTASIANLPGVAPIARAEIKSLATYVPPRLLTNADLEKLVDTSDEWILQRTGIRERHIVDPGVATSDLAKEAAIEAIRRAGITPADIDLIIVGTVTPDMLFPSTACLLQNKIGATNAWGFDVSAACSAFAYALTVGSQLIAAGSAKYALIVGADVMSSIIDYTDRTTCVLFGDGAGAVVLGRSEGNAAGILDFAHEIDGSGGAALCMPAGGSLRPASHETVDQRLHFVKQDGQTVFKFAVRTHRGPVRAPAEAQRRHRRRHRPVRLAPGQPPDHRGGRRSRRGRPLQGHHQHRALRQHHRGHDPAGPERRRRGGAAEEGRPGAHRLGRRRLHGGRAPGALGLLSQRERRVPHSDSGGARFATGESR